MNPRLQQILDHNRAIVALARALNERTAIPTFPQYTKNGLVNQFEARLREQGATSFATMKNPDALKLPPLDSKQVAELKRRCPDTITLCGMEHVVIYLNGHPKVELNPALVNSYKWLALPDEVRLPGGTLVTISLRWSFWQTQESVDLAALKRQYATELRERQWRETPWTRPAIPIPSLREITHLPSILKFRYGCSPIDDQPYVAYGVVRKLGEILTPEWVHDFAEAERLHDEACAFITACNARLVAERGGDEHRPTAVRLKKALRHAKSERHHLRETALAGLWDELVTLVELRQEDVPGNEIPALIERMQVMLKRIEEALKPPPASPASIADLTARFKGQKPSVQLRR